MLKLADFKPVSLDDRDLFSRHYRQYPQVHSDNTFANMVCWDHYADYRFAEVEGSIVLSSTIDGVTAFRMPIGPKNPALLDDVIDLALREGSDIPLRVLDPINEAWLREIYPDLPLHENREFFDYIYHTEDLAELAGKNYATIRRQVNRFGRDYAYTVEKITEENINEVWEFLVVWCEWRDCDSVPVLAAEKEAILFAVNNFFAIGLEGWIIRIGGTIGAISIVGPVNASMAVVHFEKALPETYRNIYKVITTETAAGLRDRYRYVNRECDMGVAGLRESKTRYHPAYMVEVYSATRDDLEACCR
ncbi:MAG TPA: phosphatidylglycerol lysyltransferase domain-containing protein [Methanoculleus sp.]|nr:phosphatidylglycerol lysyltransferase domain-containing protein [Methanoculleus sp.]